MTWRSCVASLRGSASRPRVPWRLTARLLSTLLGAPKPAANADAHRFNIRLDEVFKTVCISLGRVA
jgi:hypothetical protein